MADNFTAIAAAIRSQAGVLEDKARELRKYADSMTGENGNGNSLSAQLADKFAGPMLAVDILTKVHETLAPATTWHLHRSVMGALADAQRGVEGAHE